MTEQAKAARRAYKAKWAREHREQVRAQQERYWEKLAAALAQAKEAQKAQGAQDTAE